MKVTVLDGCFQGDNSEYEKQLAGILDELQTHHNAVNYSIKDMNLKFCTGCWSCWWKTPGECSIKDGADEIFKSVIHSDFLLLSSPMIAGFVSSELKKIMDRLIVLLHPYIQMINGESHHHKRYDSYPALGVLLGREAGSDEEDMKITEGLFKRFSLNFHGDLKFVRWMEDWKIEEFENETAGC